MSTFKKLDTNYKIPKILQHDVDELEKGVLNNVNYIDCLQDEIRASAHGCTDAGITEEQAEEIIDYYCRRRW